MEVYLGKCNFGIKSEFVLGNRCRMFFVDSWIVFVGNVDWMKVIFCCFGGYDLFLGESFDLECCFVWFFLLVESVIDGCWIVGYDMLDGRGSDGYVVKVCFYNSIGCFVCVVILNGEI